MLTCPGEDLLRRYALLRADGPDFAVVSTHLESCADCRRRVEEISGDRNGQATVPPISNGRGRTPETVDPPVEVGREADWPATASRGVDSRATISSALSSGASSGEARDQDQIDGPIVPGYQVMERLGEGGMGVVYKARQLGLNRLVALKMIREERQMRPDAVARFMNEAEAVARLRHPNIIQIYDIGEASGSPFVALELLEGGDLNGWLAGNPRPGRQAAELMATLARAIDFAHRAGIIHRDLKPSNILLTADGVPRVSDFGLAKRIGDESGRTYSGQVMGTPSYMAPEQARDSKQAAPAADVYSLGAIFYEMLVGRPPFKGVTPLETVRQVIHDDPVAPTRLVPRVARDLETICLKCLTKDPLKRYASALELADDLKRYLDGEPIRARPASAFERGAKWARRRPAAAGSLGALALLSLGVVLAMEYDRRARETQVKLLKAYGTEKIRTAQHEMGLNKLGDARTTLAGLQEKFEAEPAPELRDLKTLAGSLRHDVEELIGKEDSRQKDRERLAKERFDYHKFLRLRNEALLRDTPFPGLGPADNQRSKRTAAEEAIGVFAARGPEDSWTVVLPEGLSRVEKDKVIEGCYELLLILAESESAPGQGLRRLAQAASLHLPETRVYHLRRAACLEKDGDRAAAEQERRRAECVQPVGAVDHFLLGLARYKRDPVAGLRHFDDALHERPDHFWAQCLSALCLLQWEVYRPAEAHTRLSACLNREPEFDPWLYLLRGFASSQQVDLLLNRATRDEAHRVALRREAARPLDFALADYGHALALIGPKQDDLRYGLLVSRGLLWLQRQQPEQAARDLSEAIRLDGRQAAAYAAMAEVHRGQQEFDQALAQFTLAIEQQPDSADLYRKRAELELARPDKTPARRARALCDLDEAIRRERPEAHLALVQDHMDRARLLVIDGRPADALAACEAALKVRSDDALAQRLRIALLLDLQRFDEVLRSCNALIGHAGTPGWALEPRGLARFFSGDYTGAIDDYTRALGVASDRAIILAQRGWLYLRLGAPQMALTDFEEVIGLRPQDAEGYEGRGLALARIGRYRDATADAQEALRLVKRTPQHLSRIARIYAQAASTAGAEAPQKGRSMARLAGHYQDQAASLLFEAIRHAPANEAASIRSGLRTDPILRPIQRRVWAALERNRPTLSSASSGDPAAK